MQINIYETKSQLSFLLQKAQQGEEVIIARAGKPLARLIPVAASTDTRSGVRFGGLSAARLKLSEDFHELLRDDDLLAR